MKINRLRTYWTLLISIFWTLEMCASSSFKRFFLTIDRKWVDQKLLRWAHRLIQLAQVNVVIDNPHHVKPQRGKPTIIMCNHTSLYDIPLSFIAFPEASIRMLAKKELSKIPIMGKGMRAAEFPFVDRKNRTQAIKDLAKVRELLESGIVLWIAPEGTRSKDGQLQPFKKGGFITAIETGATIIPIVVKGANEILPARTHHLHLGQTATVSVGLPIDAAQYTLSDKDQLIEKTWHIMNALEKDKH